ncbi:hypothetical protein C8J57DRAFT_1465341 [Mycena rebaudengoi]|nr:hypothetical protein C8J57DRAFT_1465341 [Mycena rebaudengoi]
MSTFPVDTSESPAAHLPELFTVDSAELLAEVSARTAIRFTPLNEPYIPLPTPYEAFSLSVMRQSDIPSDHAMMNDLRVVGRFAGPPFPLALINVQKWLIGQRASCEKLFAQYAAGAFLPATEDPFTVIRERTADGTDVYAGQITVMGGEAAAPDAPVNEAWEAWRNTSWVWDIGSAIRPEYQGKGLGTAAVSVLLNEWLVPQMGLTRLRAQCFVSNVASTKLWQKHGFVEKPELRSVVKLPEAKGGEEETRMSLFWELK